MRLPGLDFVLSPILPPNPPVCSSAWDAVSGSLSCLRSCFPGCCIRFRIRFPGLVFILFPVLICNLPACSLAWDAVSGSLVSSPVFSPGMLYPTPCSYFPISQFVLQPGMVQFPNLFFSLGCCIRLPGLVSCPVSRDAVSDSLVLSLSCLRFYFPIW